MHFHYFEHRLAVRTEQKVLSVEYCKCRTLDVAVQEKNERNCGTIGFYFCDTLTDALFTLSSQSP